MKKKNEGYLPSKNEETQTLARALIISSHAHNESSYISLYHERIQNCKSRKRT
jgi:hypothetical protein